MKNLLAVIGIVFCLSCGGDATRKGDQFFEQGKFKEAVGAYNDFLSNNKANVKTLYNREEPMRS